MTEQGAPTTNARARQLDCGGLLRALRRDLELSQRDLAARLGVHQSRIARAEARPGTSDLRLLETALAAAGGRLVVLRADGSALEPFDSVNTVRDLRERRYPAHRTVQSHVVDGRQGSVARYWSRRMPRELSDLFPDERHLLPAVEHYMHLAADPRTRPIGRYRRGAAGEPSRAPRDVADGTRGSGRDP